MKGPMVFQARGTFYEDDLLTVSRYAGRALVEGADRSFEVGWGRGQRENMLLLARGAG